MNTKLRHPFAEYPDSRIRVLDEHNVLYVYVDELKQFKIETNDSIIKFILDSEKHYKATASKR
jgi:hypothetical protein